MKETLDGLVEQLPAFELEPWIAPATSGLRIALILVTAWVATRLLQRTMTSFRTRLAARITDQNSRQRAETLTRVFRYFIALLVGGLTALLVLSELGMSLAPILGASGIVGLAIGFGAQSLVKDFFSGFFILVEDQIRSGDIVKIGNIAGQVEDVTLRHVRLRDYDGNVHFVPNNLITVVTNMSRLYAWSVVDVGVAYRENVDECLTVMREVAEQLRSDSAFTRKILEPVEIAGVERWDASAVVLRCRFKVAPLEQWGVRREYLRRLKAAFDELGIEIPYPHLTVYAGAPKSGQAPPFQLQGLRLDGRHPDAPSSPVVPPAPEEAATRRLR
jgi:small-conductance mechanosensitive channel